LINIRFIYGLNEEDAKKKMESIYSSIVDGIPYETLAFRTPNAVTIVSQYPYRHIQIVLRLYMSPAEVLTGFDVDCCSVGFDGKHVWATRRAHCAFVTQVNTIDNSRRSPSYETRLAKYGQRGFEIRLPGFDRSRIDPQLYERSFDKVQGLAKLLLFEAFQNPGSRLRFKEKQRNRKMRPAHEDAGNYKSLEWKRENDLTSQNVDANDYSTVFIPYGPVWTARKIAKLAHKKDYITNSTCFFFVADSSCFFYLLTFRFLLSDPYLMHKFRTTRHHQHPLFYGTMSDVLGDCCGRCPPLPSDVDAEAERSTYVSGPLKFIIDDPGRQRIGSFHPIDDNEWESGCYLPEGLQTFVRMLELDNLEGIKKMLESGEINVDQRDWIG
jgi:hypothetical protein